VTTKDRHMALSLSLSLSLPPHISVFPDQSRWWWVV